MSREMKDSGVEWLGEIPKGWNVKKGKALYSITTGKLDANAEERLTRGFTSITIYSNDVG